MSMRWTGPPWRFHEAGFYRCDAEFGALIVPFVEEGVATGQPVILGYDDRKASPPRSWLGDPAAATFIADGSPYATPARAIDSYWRIFSDLTAAVATQIRIAGDVPHEGSGGRFAGWDRYESAANTVWDQFPVWSRCLYDATSAAPRVLDTARRTHPRIVLPSGQYQTSRRYQEAADLLAGLVPAWSGPGLDRAELWLIHMLDLDTAMIRSQDGFTIRLAAGHAP